MTFAVFGENLDSQENEMQDFFQFNPSTMDLLVSLILHFVVAVRLLVISWASNQQVAYRAVWLYLPLHTIEQIGNTFY